MNSDHFFEGSSTNRSVRADGSGPTLWAASRRAETTHAPQRLHSAVATGLSLLLILLVVGCEVGVFGTGARFQNRGSGDGPLTLDSFSPPSLAAAILRQEATRLLAAYQQQRDESTGSTATRPADGATDVAGAPGVGSPASPHNASRSDDAVATLERLQHTVQDLRLLMDCRLLGVYAQTRRDREFVDHYLHLVQEASEHGELVVWFSSAMEAARRCGRQEELTDALRHVIRFRASTGTTRSLAGLLDGA